MIWFPIPGESPMAQLSDIHSQFLRENFTLELQSLIQKAFDIAQAFDDHFVEDPFVSLISAESLAEKDIITQSYISRLKQTLGGYIASCGVTLDWEQDITLSELIGLCDLLLLIPRLESFELLEYIVNSEHPSRIIFVALGVVLSTLSEVRLMEIIEDANDELISRLKAIGLEEAPQRDIDPEHQKCWDVFSKFTDNTPCLGKTLRDSGFANNTIEELLAFIPTKVLEEIVERTINNVPQTALDLLSLLVVGKNTYQDVIVSFKQHVKFFLTDTQLITRVETAFMAMVSDFEVYQRALREAQIAQSSTV